MKHFDFDAKIENVSAVYDFLDKSLKHYKVSSKDAARTQMIAEDIFVLYCENGDPNVPVRITVKGVLGGVFVSLKHKGDNLAMITEAKEMDLHGLKEDYYSELAIRKLMMKANEERINYTYKDGINIIKLTANTNQFKQLYVILLSMILGLLVGILLKNVLPMDVCMTVNEVLFSSVKAAIMNLLKMLIAPLIFFSIISSISSMSSVNEFGKTGVQVMALYMITSVLACIFAVGVFFLIQPGTFGMYIPLISGMEGESEVSVSIIGMLLDFFPDNFLGAFVNNNTLQIMLLAVLLGIATTRAGKNASKIAAFFDAGNNLINALASIIMKLIPVMVFCCMATIAVTTELSSLNTVLGYAGTVIICVLSMMTCYVVMACIFAKCKPLQYIRNVLPVFFNAFALQSSSAAMPVTMECCDKHLLVDRKLYSFSIPLGTTINMDGTSMLMIVGVLFFAKGFGVALSVAQILSLIISVVIIAAGMPGIPGISIVCFTTICKQAGVPMEALILYSVVQSVLDPLVTANNVVGDLSCTYSVAGMNGLIRKE